MFDKHETTIVPTKGDTKFNEKLEIHQDNNFSVEFLYVDVFTPKVEK